MSRMITFYKNPDLTIPKPNIENAYVRINVKRFNILNRRISDSTFRVISMIFLLLSKSSFSLNKSSTLFGIYTPGTFFNPLTPPAVEALCMFLPICL
jgi:hypothetical protein